LSAKERRDYSWLQHVNLDLGDRIDAIKG